MRNHMKNLLLATLGLLFVMPSAMCAEETKPTAPTNAPAAAPADTAVKKAGKTFTGEAKKIEDQLTTLFDHSRKTNVPGAEGKQAREAVGNALNWDRVAKDCLGAGRWKSTSEKNRNEFRGLLKDVVEKTAYSRLAAFWKGGTTYSFKTIDVKSNEAHVVSDFNVNGDIASLEYFLEKKGSDWKIFDIAFEGLRYSKNINEQVEAFLKEKGFPNLLTQLRKRLEELNDASKSEKG